jgi:6-phosphofructokinase 1
VHIYKLFEDDLLLFFVFNEVIADLASNCQECDNFSCLTRNFSSLIVVVAEGDEEGGAFLISKKVKEAVHNIDIRITILGHTQRGGKPTCLDRYFATRMGLAAVEFL